MSRKPEQHMFKDTGITVGIRRVSPLLMLKLRERYPAPKPPMQEVDYGDGKKRLEPNPAHPDYIASMAAYDEDMERRARDLLIRRGVVVEWTDEQKAELEEVKAWWLASYGEELSGDDVVNYVSYVAIGSDSDLVDLVDALVKRSQPTEEAVKENLDRFPDNSAKA